MEDLKIVSAIRATGGMNPSINFTFSDGNKIQTKSNGYGCEYEAKVYQVLISKWFGLI